MSSARVVMVPPTRAQRMRTKLSFVGVLVVAAAAMLVVLAVRTKEEVW